MDMLKEIAVMEIQFWYELESNGREWRGQVYNDMVLEGEGITTEWYEYPETAEGAAEELMDDVVECAEAAACVRAMVEV
jgi:hypothetical protein